MESHAETCYSTGDLERKTVIDKLRGRAGLLQILGRSKVMKEMRQKIGKLAPFKVCVVICGETGTGKELVARALHYIGPQSSKPFVAVNCGAIPESLFENELFGHAKGAYTNAHTTQKGLVDEAEGGTLFLDEIGAISLCSQVKLLRLLQDEDYKRLGDSRPCKANIRVIAARIEPLERLVQKGKFREDLFYRLNVVSLAVSPLRERVEDIPVLTKHFVSEYSRKHGKQVREVSQELMRALMSYSWPGNVRELENKIQQMVVMSESPIIGIDDLRPSCVEAKISGLSFEPFNVAKKRIIDSFEVAYLSKLLAEYRGNVVSAARRAGKSRTGFWNLLRKHRLSPRAFHSYDAQGKSSNGPLKILT